MKIDFDEFIYTGRGSTALFSILKSLDINKKRILLPVNICEIIYPIVVKAGFTPVFYDVNENTGIGNLSNIQDAFSGKESVLLAVHNFGIPLDIEDISDWAKENNIFLIEDVCNSLGASFKNKLLGTWGDAAIFSFGYVKIIEHGVGGAVSVKDIILKNKVQSIINSFENYSSIHKEKNTYFQKKITEVRQQNKKNKIQTYSSLYEEYSNYLLYNIDKSDVKGIINQFNYLAENLAQRNRKAALYRKGIDSNKVNHIEEVNGQIYWRYNLLVDPTIREDLILELRKNKILVSTWYPPIVDFFINDFNVNNFSGSYLFSKKVVNLFVDHRVSESDIAKTINIINLF